jgi:hypothetical protein
VPELGLSSDFINATLQLMLRQAAKVEIQRGAVVQTARKHLLNQAVMPRLERKRLKIITIEPALQRHPFMYAPGKHMRFVMLSNQVLVTQGLYWDHPHSRHGGYSGKF